MKVITGEVNRNEESLNLLMTNTPIYPAYMNRKSLILPSIILVARSSDTSDLKEGGRRNLFNMTYISLGIEVQK